MNILAINKFKSLIHKIARKKIIIGFDKYCVNKIGRVLLYHKTDPFIFGGSLIDFSHTNNWEIYEIAKIFNRLGYVVDIIDRSIELEDLKIIKDEYVIFLGLGAGDSGKYFSDIAEKVPGAIKILYAMGTEPNLSNKIMLARHDYFRSRHPDISIRNRRLINFVNSEKLYKNTDVIMTLGNDFTAGSYNYLNKPVYLVNISTYSGLSMSVSDFSTKKANKFIYFGGNGNIRKGLDLVLEVFAKHPELTLYVGAPKTELDFNVFANDLIKRANNIHWLGFIDVTGKLFKEITKDCGYVILPSSSEGCATSVVTCMRRGCVPVVTKETGIPNLDNFGYLIPQGTLESVDDVVTRVANISPVELKEKIFKTYYESFLYTQAQFSASFEKNILSIIYNHNNAK